METAQLLIELEQTSVWLDRTAAALAGRESQSAMGEWSFSELLDHLIASDQILATRVMQVLVRPGVMLPAFDERRWAQETSRFGRSIQQRLTAFTHGRKELLAVLRSLDPSEWQLSGDHEEAGPMTIHAIVRKLADHESEHRRQAEALVGQVMEGGSMDQ